MFHYGGGTQESVRMVFTSLLIGIVFGLIVGLFYELILGGPYPMVVAFMLALVGSLVAARVLDRRCQ